MKRKLLLLALLFALLAAAGWFATTATATPSGTALITSPRHGAPISGTVDIKGLVAVTSPGFSFYKVEFGLGENPPGFGAVSGVKTSLPTGQVLDTWDTTRFPDGPAVLKLTVVDTTSNYLEYQIPVVIKNIASSKVGNVTCEFCHTEEHKRWALTLHAADPAAVLTNEEHNTAELLTDECITCHAPFQAGKFAVGDFVQPLNQQGPWHVVDQNVGAWQAIKCEVCHDPSSTVPNKLAFFDSTKQAYVAVENSTALCSKCHQPGTDDSRDLKGSVHEGLQCATCHFQKGTAMSLDPHESCAQCHPGVNPKHPDVTKLDTTFASKSSPNDIHFLKCATCHK